MEPQSQQTSQAFAFGQADEENQEQEQDFHFRCISMVVGSWKNASAVNSSARTSVCGCLHQINGQYRQSYGQEQQPSGCDGHRVIQSI